MFYIIIFINFLVCHFLAKISIMVHPLLSRTWSSSSCRRNTRCGCVPTAHVVGVWGNVMNSTNLAGRFPFVLVWLDQLSNPLMRLTRGRLEGMSLFTRESMSWPHSFSSNLLTGCQRRVAYCRRNRGMGRRHPMDRVSCGGPDPKLKADRAIKDEVRPVQLKWDRHHVRGPCPSDPSRRDEISREDHECHSRASVMRGQIKYVADTGQMI